MSEKFNKFLTQFMAMVLVVTMLPSGFAIADSEQTVVVAQTLEQAKESFIGDSDVAEKDEIVADTSFGGQFLDFKDDKDAALEWSNQNFPNVEFFNDDVQLIQEINEQLRNKYKNRSQFYENENLLNNLDNLFYTLAPRDMAFYTNISAGDFGISNSFLLNQDNTINENVYNSMLKNSQFGIDHGYTLGSLEYLSPDSNNLEIIQLQIFIPAGTPIVRVGSLADSSYILQRGNVLKYVEKSIAYNNNDQPYLQIFTEITNQETLTQDTNRVNQALGNLLEQDYDLDSSIISVEPLGFNAGLVLAQAETVVKKAFDGLKNNEMFPLMFMDDYQIFLTNGFFVHTSYFYNSIADKSSEEQKELFENFFDNTAVGATAPDLDEDNIVVGNTTSVSFDQSSSTPAGIANRLLEDISATLLHESFHHLINMTNFFSDRVAGQDFLRSVAALQNRELDTLIEIRDGDTYAETNSEEFICEAFGTKYHPHVSIAERFRNEMPLTDRFLDNLFDFMPPTDPQRLRKTQMGTDFVEITFDHATDNIGVDKYLVEQKTGESDWEQKPELTKTTVKDENGLSLPNPTGDIAPIKISGLEKNTEYGFRVSAVDEAMNISNYSNVLTIKTDSDPLVASISGQSMTRHNALIRPRVDDGEATTIKVRRTESPAPLNNNNNVDDGVVSLATTERVFPGNTTFFHDDIEPGVVYTYSMVAVDENGDESERSNEVTIRTSDDDEDRQNEDRSDDVTPDSANLNWGGMFPGLNPAGFSVFGFASGVDGWFGGLLTTLAGTVSSTLVSLTSGLWHQFVVIPLDENNNPISDGMIISVDAPPRAPTSLEATSIGISSVSLKWYNQDVTHIPGNVFYDIYRNNNLVKSVAGDVNEFVDTGLTSDTGYEYRVFTRVENGARSESSNLLQITTAVSYHNLMLRLQPKMFDTEVLSHGNNVEQEVGSTVFVNEQSQFVEFVFDENKEAYRLANIETNHVWGVNLDNSTQIVMDVFDNRDDQYWLVETNTDGSVLLRNYVQTNKVIEVTNNVIDGFRVVLLANRVSANENQHFNVLLDLQPPSAPDYLVVSDVTDNSISLEWAGATDNVGVVRYDVYDQNSMVGSVFGNQLSFTVTGLGSVSTHQFRVEAVDGSRNQSPSSNMVQAVTRPKAPTNFTASEVTDSSVKLVWEYAKPADVNILFEIYRNGELVAIPAQYEFSYTITGLNSATAYEFYVIAKTLDDNRSMPSDKIMVTTLEESSNLDDVIPDMFLRAAIHMHFRRGQQFWEQPLSKVEVESMEGTLSATSACMPEGGGVVCLEDLRVNMNNIDELPEEIGKLVNLRRLWIDNNQLTSLPGSLENLQNLVEIDVSFNRLSSQALSVLDRLPETTRVISGNQNP